MIHNGYFTDYNYKTGFSSLPLGTAFGIEIELYFFVISLID